MTITELTDGKPQAYLTGWRLTIGRRHLSQDARVKAVAQIGFGSAAAFSRACFRKCGDWPALETPGRSVRSHLR